MSELIGARVHRLEDHTLLTGSARFVDDSPRPARSSPHSCAVRIRTRSFAAVDASAARAVTGVAAVLSLDDLAPVLKQRRMMRTSNSGTRLDQSWPFALADGEVSFVGEPVAIVVADRSLSRRGCRCLGHGRLRRAAGRRPIAGRPMRRGAGAPRTHLQQDRCVQGRVRRHRRRIRQGRACPA